jgi:hypothetical protein
VPTTCINQFREAEDQEYWAKFFQFNTMEMISFISDHTFLDTHSIERPRVIPDMPGQANQELDWVEFWTNMADIVLKRDFLVCKMRYHKDKT